MSKTPKRLYYDNMTANYIVQIHVVHERTKHIEVAYHVPRKKYDAGIIESKHVYFVNKLANLLTKPLEKSQMQFI